MINFADAVLTITIMVAVMLLIISVIIFFHKKMIREDEAEGKHYVVISNYGREGIHIYGVEKEDAEIIKQTLEKYNVKVKI